MTTPQIRTKGVMASMRRLGLLFACVAICTAWIGASQAFACSRIIPVREGETQEQAWQRVSRDFQSANFRDSTSVFVADVVELKLTGAGSHQKVEVVIQPFLAVKGPMPESVIRYRLDSTGISCGDWDLPSITGPGLFYADAGSSVRGMISIGRLEDHALRDRLFEEVDYAPPRREVQPSAPSVRSLSTSGAWLWVGVGSLASLIIGFVIGRASRFSKKP